MKSIEGGFPEYAKFEPTAPGRDYYDPDNFKDELENIWFDTWLLAGREEEIPNRGDYKTVQIGNENFVLTRGIDGNVNGFYNVCRHRGSRLCTKESGHFSQGRIICPYHSWMYSADTGELSKAPNISDDDEGFNPENHALVDIKVESWDGFLWINANPDSPTLSECFNLPESWSIYEKYEMERLKVGKTGTYKVNANWKLLMDNAEECYHCGTIHPELSKSTPPMQPRQWVDEEVPETKVLKHVGSMGLNPGFERCNIDGNAYRPVFPSLSDEDARKISYLHIFPHAYLCMASDYVFAASIFPIAPDYTIVKGYWLFDPDELEKDDAYLQDAIEFWDITCQEDWAACELAQQGNESRSYQNGGTLTPIDWRVANFKKYIKNEMNNN
ncbi:aromatic ring-hydroxylating dioxygenase subunit alpha [Staphylococcus xylosus]|uniref:aromatic ring-hydroxylating oxygenase subunit alpha n=1 Tax=Staphylococcus xylosus TaxID=1288 RepID=UPI00203BE7B8|nr:aromatic ring-hydroxylating dioxygenase subunit alpha [Staphylococcus xylosus]MCM3519823.1 aromatic ring-hydroxylating dioxygenase subunit alpha [Staphylococcus xylosus]